MTAARCAPLATLAPHSARRPCRLSGRRQNRSDDVPESVQFSAAFLQRRGIANAPVPIRLCPSSPSFPSPADRLCPSRSAPCRTDSRVSRTPSAGQQRPSLTAYR